MAFPCSFNPRGKLRHVLACLTAAALPFALGACAGGDPAQPGAPPPPEVAQLRQMQAMAARSDWAALEGQQVGACTPEMKDQAACAEAHALRARACRQLANARGVEAGRRSELRDCAVEEGQAALAAAQGVPQAKRAEWRQDLAWALFERRQGTSRAAMCPDNDALRRQADTLRAEQPGLADARFLAASARLTGAAESCVPVEERCADLAEAAKLLEPAPAGDPRWGYVAEGVRTQQRVVLGCPGTT